MRSHQPFIYTLSQCAHLAAGFLTSFIHCWRVSVSQKLQVFHCASNAIRAVPPTEASLCSAHGSGCRIRLSSFLPDYTPCCYNDASSQLLSFMGFQMSRLKSDADHLDAGFHPRRGTMKSQGLFSVSTQSHQHSLTHVFSIL